jgi:hypothetical protein
MAEKSHAAHPTHARAHPRTARASPHDEPIAVEPLEEEAPPLATPLAGDGASVTPFATQPPPGNVPALVLGSGSGGWQGKIDSVWLYQPLPVGQFADPRGGPSIGDVTGGSYNQARFVRVGPVWVPSPHWPLVVYNGQYYAWSKHDMCYLLTQPVQAVLAAGNPTASPLADPATF